MQTDCQAGRQEKLAGFVALLQFNAYFMEPAAPSYEQLCHHHPKQSDGRL